MLKLGARKPTAGEMPEAHLAAKAGLYLVGYTDKAGEAFTMRYAARKDKDLDAKEGASIREAEMIADLLKRGARTAHVLVTPSRIGEEYPKIRKATVTGKGRAKKNPTVAKASKKNALQAHKDRNNK